MIFTKILGLATNSTNPSVSLSGLNGRAYEINYTFTEPITVKKTVGNCYWLNLRTGPYYGNNIYTAVKAGTVVEYLGMESGWAKIRYNGQVLYCGSSYLV